MQLFIGGACAGKRDAVSERFPAARWHRLVPEAPLDGWRESVVSGAPLVVSGWTAWLEAAIDAGTDDDRLRQAWRHELEAMGRRDGEVVLILDEVGRGIVPLAARDRRLRDLAGWLAQDAARTAEAVWYVRHGLVKALK